MIRSLLCILFFSSSLHSSQVWEALFNYNIDDLRQALEYGADANEVDETTHMTPLGQAVQYGNIDMMNLLYAHHALLKPDNAFTPLYVAIQAEKPLEILQWVFDHGASVDDEDPVQQLGKPLHWAALKGNVEIINYLVKEKKAGIDQINHCKVTPLQCACEKGHTKAIKALVELGADPLIEDDYGRKAAAFVPADHKDRTIILDLLDEYQHGPLTCSVNEMSPKSS